MAALLGRHVQGGQHLEVGAHRRQRVRSSWGHRGEISADSSALGALLLIPDTAEHALHRVTDPTASHTRGPDLVRFGLRVDGAGLLREQPEQIDHHQ